MICTGKMTNNSLNKETKFVSDDGAEIFYGYRNKFAPLKMIITGCGGKNNYIGETRKANGLSEFLIIEDDKQLLRMEKASSLMPKCIIDKYDRDLEVKFNIGLGSVKTSVIEGDAELAVMTVRRREFTLEIKDGENPTLMTTILMGAAEVNGFTDELRE